MRLTAIASGCGLLFGCHAAPSAKNTPQMDWVEERVQLPSGIMLSNYARYYAYLPDGRIIGRYIFPLPKPKPDEVCEDVEKGRVPCPDMQPSYPALDAGQRIWLDVLDQLPEINDGGCSVITITAYPETDGPITAECNGDA